MDSFLALSLIAGALAVDDRAGWQSLLAQPVFAAVIIGLWIGELQTAIIVGLVLELIWLSILPMRGQRRPDHIAGAVVGVGTACLLIKWTADSRFAFVAAVGLLVGLLAGELGGVVTARLLSLRNRFLNRVRVDTSAGWKSATRKLFWLHVGATAYVFVAEAVLVLILLWAGYSLSELLTRHVEGSLVDGAVTWQLLMPAIGAASLVHLYWHQNLKRVLILSTILVMLVLWVR